MKIATIDSWLHERVIDVHSDQGDVLLDVKATGADGNQLVVRLNKSQTKDFILALFKGWEKCEPD